MIWDYQLSIGGGVVASSLSETSKYPLQTDIATREFNRLDAMDAEIKALRATLSTYGLTKLSTATDITDANAYALSATENNPNIEGSIKNQLQILSSKIHITLVTWGEVKGYSDGEFTLPAGMYLIKTLQGGAWCDTTQLWLIYISRYENGCSTNCIVKAGSQTENHITMSLDPANDDYIGKLIIHNDYAANFSTAIYSI